ncbi:hypothetical protein RBB77_13060 [Tunturibacter psychrotolerans]|uniref:Uncharacterized protein n=1 Tax=Tunturiibacter psychrotolerans TaxID=3069686 RepID=A0AAU7ZJZ9_9BACT
MTSKGEKEFLRLGVDMKGLRATRRRFASQCIDWSERRPHLGGAVGAAIFTLALKRKWVNRDQLYAREIAVEVNRLIEVRGERSKLSPEKVGHRLRKLGLPTRRLSQAGNGLVMDKETRTRLQMLSAMYVREDQLAVTENLHSLQATENKEVGEVM